MTVRVGVVGCGFIGSIHALVIGELVKAHLVEAALASVFDDDPGRAAHVAAQHPGAVVSESLEVLLDSVDAVWVCTWTAAHRQVVAAAVERGLAVFCEKPLAPSFVECEEGARLLRQVPHQVGLVLRHAPVFGAAADVITSGRYGRPLATILRDDQYFPIQGIYNSNWRAEVGLAGGGTLIEHSIHDVDVLRWLLGDPATVHCHVGEHFGHRGIDDVAAVTFGYPDGSAASLVSVWHQVLSRPSSRRLEVFCEDALVWTDDDHLGPLHIETAAGVETVAGDLPDWAGRLVVPEGLVAPIAQYGVPTKAFLDALATGRSGRPDVGVALAAHRLVELAYRSAASGDVEHLEGYAGAGAAGTRVEGTPGLRDNGYAPS